MTCGECPCLLSSLVSSFSHYLWHVYCWPNVKGPLAYLCRFVASEALSIVAYLCRLSQACEALSLFALFNNDTVTTLFIINNVACGTVVVLKVFPQKLSYDNKCGFWQLLVRRNDRTEHEQLLVTQTFPDINAPRIISSQAMSGFTWTAEVKWKNRQILTSKLPRVAKLKVDAKWQWIEYALWVSFTVTVNKWQQRLRCASCSNTLVRIHITFLHSNMLCNSFENSKQDMELWT